MIITISIQPYERNFHFYKYDASFNFTWQFYDRFELLNSRTIEDENVKNLLSPAVNRGDLRRLNYNKTVFGDSAGTAHA